MGYKKRFGDRHEGRRLRTLEPFNAMIPFIMKVKSDASNLFKDSVEITETEKYLRQKRIDGYPGMGFLHLFCAAYIRVVSQYPGINRFVSGQRVFARHKIELFMTVKKELKAAAPETSVKVIFDQSDTVYDVHHKLNTEIQKIKTDDTNDTDDIAKFLIKLPRPLLKFAISFLTFLDYFGKMPKSVLKASPFHCSVAISDIGSVGLPVIYHHLYNFGNTPVFISFGAKRKVYELNSDGETVLRKYVDFTLVMDERICDGFYVSQIFRLFKSILRNPKILDDPPETVVEDIE